MNIEEIKPEIEDFVEDLDCVIGICQTEYKEILKNKFKTEEKYFVYYLFDSKDNLIYVGYTFQLVIRMMAHKGNKRFNKILLIRVSNKKDAFDIERTEIKYYKPKLNKKSK